jgi:hypothetical protein
MIKMLKAVKTLINAMENGAKKAHCGNHSAYNVNGKYRYFYHNTCICEYNLATKKVEYDNGGWETSSTTRSINSYKSYYGEEEE